MLVWGLGAIGSGIVRVLARRRGVSVAGGVCEPGEAIGQDVGILAGLDRPLGVDAIDNGNFAVQLARPDIVLTASGSTVEEDFEAIETALAYKADVISLAEEMTYPWVGRPELARRIGELAAAAGKTVLGTGARPGFFTDAHVLALSAACVDIRRILLTSVRDLSGLDPRVLARFGVGLQPRAFEEALSAPRGHIGFVESAAMIADALGVKLVGFDEDTEPMTATAVRRAGGILVEPGQVAGMRQRLRALSRHGVFVEFDQVAEIDPGAEGRESFDELVVAAEPPVVVTMRPGVDSTAASIALACNMIPLVIKAPPGLLAMPDLLLPRGVEHDTRLVFRRAAVRGRLYPMQDPAKERAGGTREAGAVGDASGDQEGPLSLAGPPQDDEG